MRVCVKAKQFKTTEQAIRSLNKTITPKRLIRVPIWDPSVVLNLTQQVVVFLGVAEWKLFPLLFHPPWGACVRDWTESFVFCALTKHKYEHAWFYYACATPPAPEVVVLQPDQSPNRILQLHHFVNCFKSNYSIDRYLKMANKIYLVIDVHC